MQNPTLLAPALALALALPAQVSQEPQGEPHHLVQVYVRDAATLDKLVRLELDLAGCSAIKLPAKTVDVVATDADIDTLRKSRFDFDVAIRNLEDHYERELAKDRGFAAPAGLNPPVGQGGMGGHYTLAEMNAILDTFVKNHPALCSKTSLGKSREGRDIWMVKISDNVNQDENEPEVYYDSVHHAREPLGMTTLLQFIDGLLSGYKTDPEAKRIVDGRELYCVPCVNPDGYEYNRRIRPNGGGMWRKNRRNNGGGIYGVDLNRNYSTGWNAPFGGNSTNPRSDTYRGPSAFSEPEVAAINNFWKNRKFFHVFSCHTYTEVLLRPWGYQRGNPPNNADYNALGTKLTASNRMRHGAASTLLYIAAGTTLDHGHVAQGAYGWTPELGTRSEGGFWPNRTNQVRIANRHQHMFRQVALTAQASITPTYKTFGSGCKGSNGTPALTANPPKVGTLMTINIAGAPGNAPCVLVFGGSTAKWGNLTLPFSLAPLGGGTCSVLVSPDVQLPTKVSAFGFTALNFNLPNDEALLGQVFHNQWFVIDGPANRLGITSSNGGTGTIGN